ncbi:MAG: acyl-CoA thioesterase [Bacteroidota bacterium]
MKKLADYPIQQKYQVHWGDMDAAQHVNNLVYLKWSESVRIYFFDQLFGGAYDFNEGIGPILAWQDCKYIFPITFPDNAIVGVKTVEILPDRFIIETATFSEKNNRIAAFGQQTIMAYHYGKLKKAELPSSWQVELKKYL